MNRAITLLSGGLDSMVSTAMARRRHKVVLALTFDYGQRAVRREVEAAKKICKLWRIPHRIISLPWLKEITKTALVDKSLPLTLSLSPRPTTGGQAEGRGWRVKWASARRVWVPNRNAIFINIAAAFAEVIKAKAIITGFNREEAATFPDNAPSFVQTVNKMLTHSTLFHPRVVSCTQGMNKREILKFALGHRLPIEHIWPCYEGGREWCGKCESCVRLGRALT